MKRRMGITGFTLVELMVVMAITMFVLVAASRVMISMVSQFKTQSKIAETSLESSFGMELIRRDLSRAGYGLPYGILNTTTTSVFREFDWKSLTGYNEISVSAPNCPACSMAATFNDATAASKAPPRFVLAGNPSGTLNGSDYFVIKGLLAGDSSAAGKFHLLDLPLGKNKWYKTNTTEDISVGKPFQDISLRDLDWVMVLSMKDTDINGMGLVQDGAEFVTTFYSTANYAPEDNFETRVIMGLADSGTAKPRAPFNRSDYYISINSAVPAKCAPGTGVLVKAVMQHSNGGLGTELPMIDCVADFQAIFALDTDDDGDVDSRTDSLAGMTAAQIRDQVKEVSLYILTHEGQMDPKYDYSQNNTVTKVRVGDYGLGREFNFTSNFTNQASVGTMWKWFRWRVLRISEKPTAIQG